MLTFGATSPIPPYDRKMNTDHIKKYYDDTRFDYNVAWFTNRNLSIHFGFYDEHANRHDNAVLNTNRVMADAVNIQPGERVLDAGCGVGGTAFWLVEHRGAIVTGITPVKHQVDACQTKAKELGLSEQADFQQVSYLETGFPDSSFDVVWACESVCHAENKADFYREAARLLKPGGRLVMAEYMRFHRPMEEPSESKMLRGFSGWAISDIDAGKEHFDMATQAGLEKIIIRDCSKYVRVSFRNVWRHCKRWLWLGKILRAVGIRSKVQHGNLTGTIDICETFLDGHWFYGLLTAVKK